MTWHVDVYYYIIVTENTKMNAQYIENTFDLYYKYEISNKDGTPPPPPKHRLSSYIDLGIVVQE